MIRAKANSAIYNDFLKSGAANSTIAQELAGKDYGERRAGTKFQRVLYTLSDFAQALEETVRASGST